MQKSGRLHQLNQKKISNPFIKDKNRDKFKKRFILFLIILTIVIVVKIYLLFFSNFFIIKNINVNDLERIEKGKIEEIIKNQMKTSNFLIFPENVIFFFSKNNLLKNLDNYNFYKINIRKSLPGTINVEIKERSIVYVYRENDVFYYLDENANIITTHNICQDKIETQEPESVIQQVEQQDLYAENIDYLVGADNLNNLVNEQEVTTYECVDNEEEFLKNRNFPYIENVSSSRLDNSGKYVRISKEYLDFTSRLYNDLGIESDFRVKKFILDHSRDTVKVELINGLLILFNLRDNYEVQLENFHLLRREYGEELINFRQIDIRYGNKIYITR